MVRSNIKRNARCSVGASPVSLHRIVGIVLRIVSVSLLTSLIILTTFSSIGVLDLSSKFSSMERAKPIFEQINDYRASYGVTELIEHEGLCELAEERLKEIKTDWSHDRLYSRYYGGGLDRYFPNFKQVGENLVQNRYHLAFDDTIEAWRNSPSHRELMENHLYKFGCVAQDRTHAVAIFAY